MKGKIARHIELSAFYKALAHPARLAIIEKLLVTATCNCNEFVQEFPFAQATISEHLRKLKAAGLISVSEKGSSSEYSLNKQRLRQMIKTQQQKLEMHLSSSLPSDTVT